jgi:hypothetical protein
MKRNQSTTSNKANRKPRTIESRRLAEARGGVDLGISVLGQLGPCHPRARAVLANWRAVLAATAGPPAPRR